jgi:hypothetical protein
MAAIKTLCYRAIFFENGSIFLDDNAGTTVSKYLNARATSNYLSPSINSKQPHISRVWFSDTEGKVKESIKKGEPVIVNVEIENKTHKTLELELAFFDSSGSKLWNFTHKDTKTPPITASPIAKVKITFHIPVINLQEVFVHIGLRIHNDPISQYVDHITEGLRFFIEETQEETYKRLDTLLFCPVDFWMNSNEK